MLETSKDLLYIVLAFCALWLTIFICWVIFYFAMILKKINGVMEVFSKTTEAVGSFFNQAKEKLEKAGTSLTLLLELGKKIYDSVAERRANKKASAKKSRDEEE